MKAQIADTELLLKSHQEQLAELKKVMESMSTNEEEATNPTAPSTPGLASKFDKSFGPTEVSASTYTSDVTPSYPTSFTHLLQPVLRTDLTCYDDFSSLLRVSKLYQPPGSRASSGSYGGMGIGLGLGNYMGSSSSSTVQQAHQNASNTSIPSGYPSSPATPTTPASAMSNASTPIASTLPLKETKFYKRALAEDIEPCLRLDTAPGLSWLARRSVLNSMCEGTLVVEPMSQASTSKLYQFPCSLCGESRKGASHARTHRFRTSESDTAQRYPLCRYCLGRVRSCCDFLGFLRVLKDGHWRTDDEEAEKAAWEESVRLREQMFWCRVGGGVIPASQHLQNGATAEKSPRTTLESEREKEMMESIAELERTGIFKPRDITPVTDAKPTESRTSSSLGKTSEVAYESTEEPATQEATSVDEVERTSLTIPGSFDGEQ